MGGCGAYLSNELGEIHWEHSQYVIRRFILVKRWSSDGTHAELLVHTGFRHAPPTDYRINIWGSLDDSVQLRACRALSSRRHGRTDSLQDSTMKITYNYT